MSGAARVVFLRRFTLEGMLEQTHRVYWWALQRSPG